jgi:sec-independent protein translocase protein TatA
MGTFSIWHWLIVLAVVLVLFGGKGKISAIMGDFGKGLKSFKKGMKDEEGAGDGGEKKAINADAGATAERSADKDTAAKG